MEHILIFENEFDRFRNSFKSANVIYYKNKLKFEVHSKFQDFSGKKSFDSYRYIIVDINLSHKSVMNGFEIIKFLVDKYGSLPIIVLTGNTFAKEKLIESDLGFIPILKKPVFFKRIKEIFDEADALYYKEDEEE